MTKYTPYDVTCWRCGKTICHNSVAFYDPDGENWQCTVCGARPDIGVSMSGLRWARCGDVKVTLYAGSRGGMVSILRNGEWGIARPGDVCYGLIIELTMAAANAS